MKKGSLLALVACLLFAFFGPFGAHAASAQEVDEANSTEEPPSTEADAVCIPACGLGHVCHPRTGDYVSACNPHALTGRSVWKRASASSVAEPGRSRALRSVTGVFESSRSAASASAPRSSSSTQTQSHPPMG